MLITIFFSHMMPFHSKHGDLGKATGGTSRKL